MKYLSPFKFMLEIVYRAEFKDSPIGMKMIDNFDYTLGSNSCRAVLGGLFVAFKILGYVLYYRNAKKVM